MNRPAGANRIVGQPTVGRRSKASPRLQVELSFCRAAKVAVRRMQQVLALVAPASALLRSCLDDSSKELWVGDSHVLFINECGPATSRLTRVDGHRFVWHVGPRLMWSIARNGFPPDVLFLARLIRMFGGSRNLSLVVVFGEIDVRAHLADAHASPLRDMRFVSDYLRQCQVLGQRLGARCVVLAVPVPPKDAFKDTPGFPRSGTLEERIDAFRFLQKALVAAVDSAEALPATVLLDCTEEIADSDGSLRADLTDDDCHVNNTGAEVVRACLRELQI